MKPTPVAEHLRVFATHPLVAELALVLVRLAHVASVIINANHGIM